MRPGKLVMAIRAPAGMPTADPSATAEILTRKDSHAIAKTSLSSVQSLAKVSAIVCCIKCGVPSGLPLWSGRKLRGRSGDQQEAGGAAADTIVSGGFDDTVVGILPTHAGEWQLSYTAV